MTADGPADAAGVANMLFHFRITSNTITQVSTNMIKLSQQMSFNEICSDVVSDGILRHQPNTLCTPAVNPVMTTNTNGTPVQSA